MQLLIQLSPIFASMEIDGLDKFSVFQARRLHLFIESTSCMNVYKPIEIFSQQTYNNVDDINYAL